jgi:sec-independent protein translocase protein TatA
MPSLGPAEILVVLVIALLVFGPNKMPDIARQVGKGFREFRRVQQHLKSELRDVVSEFDSPSTATVDQQAVPMLPPKDVAAPDATPVAESTPAPTAPTEPPPIPTADAPSSHAAPLPSPEPDAPSEPA